MDKVLDFKLVGFIKEYNNKIEDSLTLENYLGNDIEYDKVKVIDYLKNGKMVLAWMGYFKDFQSKDLIAPDAYYTDGYYIWPSYLSYYIEKYSNFNLDKSFIRYLEEKNYEFPVVDDKILLSFENSLAKIL